MDENLTNFILDARANSCRICRMWSMFRKTETRSIKLYISHLLKADLIIPCISDHWAILLAKKKS